MRESPPATQTDSDDEFTRSVPWWLLCCVGCPVVGALARTRFLFLSNYQLILGLSVLLLGIVPLFAAIYFSARTVRSGVGKTVPLVLLVCLLPWIFVYTPLADLVSTPAVHSGQVLKVLMLVGTTGTRKDQYDVTLDDGHQKAVYTGDLSIAHLKPGDRITVHCLERLGIILSVDPIEPATLRPTQERVRISMAAFLGLAAVGLLPGVVQYLRALRAQKQKRPDDARRHSMIGFLALIVGMAIIVAIGAVFL